MNYSRLILDFPSLNSGIGHFFKELCILLEDNDIEN